MGWSDVGLLLIRLVIGGTLIMHGWNHWFGGGKIPGTARWFDGLGLRPGIVHAWASVVTELGAGVLLVLGLLTPLGCAGAIGPMAVAGIAAHRRNGFFVFRDGFEYVLMIAVVSVALAAIGPGQGIARPCGRDQLRRDGRSAYRTDRRARWCRVAAGHLLAAGIGQEGRAGGGRRPVRGAGTTI